MQGIFTVLLVTDDPGKMVVLRRVLEEQGYGVDAAADGMEAITKTYHCPPSLVIADVRMPELNGYHLCRLLKNDSRTAHIPVVLLTGHQDRHDRFWGQNAGADRYLEYGRDLNPLLSAISHLLPHDNGTPPLCSLTPPRPVDYAEIRARINEILDNFLYGSTISNEVLKLTGLVHDVDRLCREMLAFLSLICRNRLAALLLREGPEQYVLAFAPHGGIARPSLDQARETMLRLATPGPALTGHLRELATEEAPVGEMIADPLHVLAALPIRDSGELLALIAMFGEEPTPLPEESSHALQVAADHFLIVARYLTQIKKNEALKADFLSMLVHDLRAPLTGISGFAEVLADGQLGSLTEDQLAALKNIQNGGEQMLLLIEDILDLAKLEAGKFPLQPVPITFASLAEQVVQDLAALAIAGGLGIRLDFPEELPQVFADERQLRRVITNLLSNAIKFTPRGGKIRLSAIVQAPSHTDAGHCLLVSVTDAGPGIPPEERQRLFSRYHQGTAARTFHKGTGLGLAICKEVVTRHGGTIWVDNPAEGGSRFSFTLPITDR